MALKVTKFDKAHEYAKDGRFDALRDLIIENSEEDDTFIDHYHKKSETTMLTTACAEGQRDIVELLIDGDARLDLPNGKNNTPLIEAALHGYLEIVEMLIQANCVVECKGNRNETALSYAARYGHDKVVAVLLANGATIGNRNDDGETALMSAIKFEHFTTAKMLLEVPDQMAVIATAVPTPTPTAARVPPTGLEGGESMISADESATVTTLPTVTTATEAQSAAAASSTGATPAAAAAVEPEPPAPTPEPENLTQVGINAVDKNGDNALLRAVFGGRLQTATFVVDNGGDLSSLNRNGETALIVAARNRNMPLCKYLLQLPGVNVNAKDKGGRSALLWACMSRHTDVALLLLTTTTYPTGKAIVPKLDPNSADLWLYTPLMFACKVPALLPVAEQLVKHPDCEVNLQDRQFNTALFHACKAGNMKAVTFLIETAGADTNITNEDNKKAGDYLTLDEAGRADFERMCMRASAVRVPAGGYRPKPHWTDETAHIE